MNIRPDGEISSSGHAFSFFRIVARLQDPHAMGIAIAEMDLDQLQAVRTKMPIQLHRTKGQSGLVMPKNKYEE